ncbi:MAG TPA: response regulator, partial [Candidatus Baltobacteraceae bacterium]|nr:response regulator [Candidatus Baltobacteraceae bacterium]
GWVEAASEKGKGTTFDVFFPTAPTAITQEETETENHPHTPVVGGAETILVVEDEQVLREMARDILQDCGYKILEACDGKEALAIWKSKGSEIELLLTDLVMPEGISGVDLAERLLDDRPDLKIVFTSGYSSNEINAELLARAQAQFLQKPYTHTTLAKTIRTCLDKNVSAGIPA